MIDVNKSELRLIATCLREQAKQGSKFISSIRKLVPEIDDRLYGQKIENIFKLADRLQFNSQGRCNFCGLLAFDNRRDHECPKETT